MALLVCLIPTTIGGLLSAIGIAGMDRLLRKNVLAMSGRAVEAAGDVDTLLLDKTGTITLGNRMATELLPSPGVRVEDLADAAQLASLADETPEGRSIVVLAKEKYGLRGREVHGAEHDLHPVQRPDAHERRRHRRARHPQGRRRGDRAARGRAGRRDAAASSRPKAARIGDSGGTPLAVSDGARVLGIVHLKDVVKGGIKERFDRFRAMGIRTVMITGDNPRTAAAIAREAGVDDFLAEATPEAKMRLIQAEQAKGKLVAMTGDGTNDAPALAQADVGVAMNTGTQAAKEAGNMVDLDSNPTKLLEVVEVGKQLLMTRGTLTTFSIANDVAKYFAILPALFVAAYPELAPLDVMHLASPFSAILSAVIFNALIIVLLIPLALAGVKYRPARRGGGAPALAAHLRRRRGRRAVRRASSSSTWRSRPQARLGGTMRRRASAMPARRRRHRRARSGPRSRVPALRATIVTLVLTGLAYPLPMTGLAQGLFHAPGEGEPRHRRRRRRSSARSSWRRASRRRVLPAAALGRGREGIRRRAPRAARTSARPRRSCTTTRSRRWRGSRRRTRTRRAPARGARDRLGERPRPAPLACGGALAGSARRACARACRPTASARSSTSTSRGATSASWASRA